MRAVVRNQEITVYSTRDRRGQIIAVLPVESEFTMGFTRKISGELWTPVLLPSQTRGYVFGDFHYCEMRRGLCRDKDVTVFESPDESSRLVACIQKTSTFDLLETVDQDERTWVKLRTLTAEEGWIDGSTPFIETVQFNRSSGALAILIGAAALALGLFVTITTYNRAALSQDGGSYMIWGAPIIIGIGLLYYGFKGVLTAKV